MFELAELFNHEYILIPERPGDRFESLIDFRSTYTQLKWKPKHKLINWINRNEN